MTRHPGDLTREQRAIAQTMLARWKTSGIIGRLDTDDEALGFSYWVGGGHPAHKDIARAWIATEGAQFTMEVLHRYRALLPRARTTTQRRNVAFMEKRELVAYRELRRELALIPDDEWRAAEARARALWHEAGMAQRMGLAFAFPEHPEWGDEAADACAAYMNAHGGTMPNGAALLFASGASLGALQTVLDARTRYPDGNPYWEVDMGPYLYNTLDLHGLAAAPMIAGLYRDVLPAWRKIYRSIIDAACVVHSPVIARALADRLDEWFGAPKPELAALEAMRPHATPALRGALLRSKRGESVERRVATLRRLREA